jgi:hypothetical protein
MKRFHKIKMEGKYWGVFLVNPNDATDRYLVSGTFDKEQEAEHLVNEFNRIANEIPQSLDSIPFLDLKP